MKLFAVLKTTKAKIALGVGVALVASLLLSMHLYANERKRTDRLNQQVSSLQQEIIQLETQLEIERAQVTIKEVIVEKLVEKEAETIYITETITVEVERDVERIIETAADEDRIPLVTDAVIDSMWKQYCLSATTHRSCATD